jgi:putative Holliday junction resolvase
MRYLALDVGNKRVGIAVGSSEGGIASPLRVMPRQSVDQDAALLKDIIREYDVDEIIVGLPHNADGSTSEQETRTHSYVSRLGPLLGVPVSFYDERYSTSIAMQSQRQRGVSEKQGRGTLDANAAAVILQDFLDSRRTNALDAE